MLYKLLFGISLVTFAFCFGLGPICSQIAWITYSPQLPLLTPTPTTAKFRSMAVLVCLRLFNRSSTWDYEHRL